MPFTTLPGKPNAPIAYDFVENHSNILIVFINGLGLPASSWQPVIDQIQASASTSSTPSLLTYDRFGQGRTESRDPVDSLPGKEPGYGHDLQDVVGDLESLLQMVAAGVSRLIFVSASIGVHIARLYDQQHPGRVLAHLMLDSNIGNLTLSQMWPDPNSPTFDEKGVVSDDCTLEEYKKSYQRAAIIFDPTTKNAEGLDRRNIKDLLPDASSPKLSSSDGQSPWLTVVGHDPIRFADEGAELMKVPRSITNKYTRVAWERYNIELLKLNSNDRTKGVVFAPNCGHFIQRDNPDFVASELLELIGKV